MQHDLIEYVTRGRKDSAKFSLVESKRSSSTGLDNGSEQISCIETTGATLKSQRVICFQ